MSKIEPSQRGTLGVDAGSALLNAAFSAHGENACMWRYIRRHFPQEGVQTTQATSGQCPGSSPTSILSQ